MKYGDPKCRFTANDGTVVIMDGQFVQYPLDSALPEGQKFVPNSIQCSAPVWQLHKGVLNETVKLDVSVNGQNFAGGFNYTFTEILEIHRTVPMSGPLTGNANTKLIGTGYNPKNL